MNSINDLLESKVTVVQQLARQAQEYQALYRAGSIQKEQYDRGVAAILEVKNQVVVAESEEFKQAIGEAVEFLSHFLKI